MIKIRINRTIAHLEIGRLIDRAEEPQESLRNVGGNTYEDFERVRSGYLRWSADVQLRLHTMFEEGGVFTAEWTALQVGCIDEDESRLHNTRRLMSSAECGILWLKDLQSHLSDIPESPRTPVRVRP